MRVNGPYVYPSGSAAGRRYVIIKDSGSKRQILYSRYLMEQHLGRRLDPSEVVDHWDEDKTNDDLGNLRLTTLAENSRKSILLRRPKELLTFSCPVCECQTTKEARNVRGNLKKGRKGPYCGKRCARLAQLQRPK